MYLMKKIKLKSSDWTKLPYVIVIEILSKWFLLKHWYPNDINCVSRITDYYGYFVRDRFRNVYQVFKSLKTCIHISYNFRQYPNNYEYLYYSLPMSDNDLRNLRSNTIEIKHGRIECLIEQLTIYKDRFKVIRLNSFEVNNGSDMKQVLSYFAYTSYYYYSKDTDYDYPEFKKRTKDYNCMVVLEVKSEEYMLDLWGTLK